jgi:hypothetical protein
MSTYKYKSKSASARTVKRFFANSPQADKISLDEIYAAAGRQDLDAEKNRSWLSNLATHLYYHDLVKPLYSYDSGYKKLKGMQLTLSGKRAIGRIEEDAGPGIAPANPAAVHSPSSGAEASLSDVAKLVKDFRDNNPEFEVVFDVKLKEIQLK